MKEPALVESVNNISALTSPFVSQASAKGRVVAAIKAASDRTGVDFAYLVNKAAQESGFNPVAKAAGSSATGLYQFIDQTWLKTVKENGEAYGLGEMADKIKVGSDGIARVANEADKKAILALRKNPEIAANMAAELAKDNKEALQKSVGGKVGATEMYLAHFLGSGGAADFLSQMKSNPSAKAADILPQAASANKGVFYNKETGEARSVGDVYKMFAKKFDKTPDLSGMDVQVASATKAGNTYRAGNVIDMASYVEKTTANEIAVGSIYTTESGTTLGKSTNSSFAAMVLAQMDMETFALDAKYNASRFGTSDEERRKSALSTLAAVG